MVSYCIINVSGKFFGGKEVVVDFGEDQSLIDRVGADIYQQTMKVQEVTTLVDMLNYMASIGWEVVHLMPLNEISGTTSDNLKYLMKLEI